MNIHYPFMISREKWSSSFFSEFKFKL